MWVVGPATTTRETKPAPSIRWATCRPKVVLPAAGVAEARKLVPGCARTASAASCCQERRGRASGQSGSDRARSARPTWCWEERYKDAPQYGRPRSQGRQPALAHQIDLCPRPSAGPNLIGGNPRKPLQPRWGKIRADGRPAPRLALRAEASIALVTRCLAVAWPEVETLSPSCQQSSK